MASANQIIRSFQAMSLDELKASINKNLKENEPAHQTLQYKIHSISHSSCFNGNAILYSAIVVFEIV